MSLIELEKVIGPLGHQLKNVTLYGTRGEPLLHPKLSEAIHLIKRMSGASIDVSTNGSLVTAKRSQELLDSGLDRIIFAVDGLSQNTFAAYRVGGRLETVLTNLKRMCELKAAGDYRTRIILQLIPMATNEAEIPQLPQLAGDLGVDEVRLKLSSSVSRSTIFRPTSDYRSESNNLGFDCPFGSDKLYVDPNGDCYPCCYGEGHTRMVLGNAFESSILDIWNSSLTRRIRIPFVEGVGHHSFCIDRCKTRPPRVKQKLPILHA